MGGSAQPLTDPSGSEFKPCSLDFDLCSYCYWNLQGRSPDEEGHGGLGHNLVITAQNSDLRRWVSLLSGRLSPDSVTHGMFLE